MSQCVVDVLEAVQIKVQQCNNPATTFGTQYCLGQPIQYQDPVGKIRQAIKIGLMQKTLLIFHLNRDVLYDRKVMTYRANRPLNRRNGCLFPEKFATLLSIAELAPPLIAGTYCLPKFLILLIWGFSRFQNTGVLTNDILAGVTGDLCKLGIHVFYGAIGIRDNDRGGALVDGLR